MAHAAERVDECALLASRPVLTFESGRYKYRIERRGKQSHYAVTDGDTTVSVPIAWCFGHGKAGQTYVFEQGGVFHESRVSYFARIDGLAPTMGAPPGAPASLAEGIGRPMSRDDVRGCFGCHTTFSSKGAELQLAKALPGVSCEACHGPAGGHPEAVTRKNSRDRGVFNPGRLGTEELSNFCGSCHRSWEAVMLAGIRGVANVRFQPYRLTNSKCYDAADPRIRCITCHDPHVPRRTEARSYDKACLACHASAGGARAGKQKACPKARQECSSCHMPRYEIPGSHFGSTDHHIRVVRSGDPYPN